MGRIRTIKPEFWRHEILSSLPEPTHMLAASLINYADDDGYFNANPGLIMAECSPLREPSVSIQQSLISLSAIGYLRIGVCPDGRKYGHITSFDKHQRINRPTLSKIKDLPIEWEGSSTPHAQLSEPSLPEGKGREGKRKGKTAVYVPSPEVRELYEAYPRHTCPIPAYHAIEKALAVMSKDELLERVNAYASQPKVVKMRQGPKDENYIPYPATWFNAGSYEDEDLIPQPKIRWVREDGTPIPTKGNL